MADKRDYYEVLGVSKNATDDEIKRAYRKKAKECHPDLHPDDKSAVERFKELGSNHEDIHAAIGPAIDACCFEVGSEVIEAVRTLLNNSADAYITAKDNGKYMLDLRGVVRERLIQLGLKPDNIELVGDCTMCHPELYYSHRYSNGARGSLAATIQL